jgi:hypothetical protein
VAAATAVATAVLAIALEAATAAKAAATTMAAVTTRTKRLVELGHELHRCNTLDNEPISPAARNKDLTVGFGCELNLTELEQ